VNVIIAAIAGGLLVLWGGIAGLLKLVDGDLFERKHMLFLGAFTTLVTGCVMGLVLFTNFERQKESRRDLQAQMENFSGRLGQLSEKLVNQLDEKAQLTASEFEIRVRLQNETTNHHATQAQLATQIEDYHGLKQTLDDELAARRAYQTQAEAQRQQRSEAEDARFKGLRESMEVYRRSLQTTQKQLSTLREDISQLRTHTAGIQKTQNSILGQVNSSREVFANRLAELEKKLADLASAQSSSRQEVAVIRTQIDSLYIWEQK
jgi:chromosome segregation ATPase